MLSINTDQMTVHYTLYTVQCIVYTNNWIDIYIIYFVLEIL